MFKFSETLDVSAAQQWSSSVVQEQGRDVYKRQALYIVNTVNSQYNYENYFTFIYGSLNKEIGSQQFYNYYMIVFVF